MHDLRYALPAISLALIVSCGTSTEARRAESDETDSAQSAEETPSCQGERGAERCLQRGLALADESNAPEEQARGLVLLERACRVGRDRGCEAAGDLHLRFDSPEQAADYYAEGCRLERDAACLALADLYHDEADPHDAERAAEIYVAHCRLAADEGVEPSERARSCRRAGAYHLGAGRASEGAEFLERGCMRGDGPACRLLGEARLRARGELEARPRLAYSLFRHGCRRGDGPACLELAKMYRRGSPTVRSAKRAEEYAQKACRAEHEPGCSFEVPTASTSGTEASETDGEGREVHISGPREIPTMPRDELKRIIGYHLPHLRHCYESRLVERPKLAGKVTLALEIGEDGELHKVGLMSDTLGDTEMSRCLSIEARTWLFPQPPSGLVRVRYPLVFEPSS
jgi:hypothetical protein